MATFDSQFEGFWTDAPDWERALSRQVAESVITPEEADLFRHFIESGYVVLENAVSPELCDAITGEIERVSECSDKFICRTARKSYSYATREATADKDFRLIDYHVNSPSAQAAMYSPKIRRFLELLFRDSLLAFQSLTFIYGSQQGIHQDSAYVVVSEPLKFAASWIALEDVKEGSGELLYYPGSHRLPDHLFSGKYKSWDSSRDGQEAGVEFIRSLQTNIAEHKLEQELFRPKKGDALIWAADLVHGGAPIVNESTRKSMVTHYCPLSVDPNYKRFSGTFYREPVDEGCYQGSRHYDLRRRRKTEVGTERSEKLTLLSPTFMGRRQLRHKLSGLVARVADTLRNP